MSLLGNDDIEWLATGPSIEIPIGADSPLAGEINQWMREQDIEGIAISTYGVDTSRGLRFPRVCQVTMRNEADLVQAKLRWG